MKARTPFQGKVLLVYLVQPPQEYASGIAIADPVMEERFGRLFVTGRVPRYPNDWASGLRVGVAVEQISHFLEFRGEEEYYERCAHYGGDENTGPIQ